MDFDGVLHSPGAIAGAQPPLTPVEIQRGWPDTFMHLPLLANLLKDYSDVAVVVSSSWRMFLDDIELGELLKPISHWYAGSTGNVHLGRDKAIKEWLRHNTIKEFIILDDVESFFPGNWPMLILCKPNDGISDLHVLQKLQAWLGSASSSEICK